MAELSPIASVVLDIPVKTYDVDFAQIVHNAVYIRWLEDLRTALMERHCPLANWMQRDLMPVLLETHIRYRRAIRLFESVRGEMHLLRFGPVRWELGASFSVAGEKRAEATQIGCFISLHTHRAVPIPADLRRMFQPA